MICPIISKPVNQEDAPDGIALFEVNCFKQNCGLWNDKDGFCGLNNQSLSWYLSDISNGIHKEKRFD